MTALNRRPVCFLLASNMTRRSPGELHSAYPAGSTGSGRLLLLIWRTLPAGMAPGPAREPQISGRYYSDLRIK